MRILAATLTLTLALAVPGCASKPPLLEPVDLEEPVKRVTPVYPETYAFSGDEGFVTMNIVIEPDGSVVDPIVEDSAGPLFESSALQAVHDWRYAPAAQSDERSQTITLPFRLNEGPPFVSSEFAKRSSLILQRIAANEFAAAERGIAELAERGGLNARSRAYLYALDATLADKLRDGIRELGSLRRALRCGENLLQAEQYPRALLSIFGLQVEQAHFRAALHTYDTIHAQPSAPPELVETLAAQIRARITSSDELTRPGRIALRSEVEAGAAPRVWNHELLRREMSLMNVDGSLEAVEFRCRRHREREPYVAEQTWKLPPSWGECSAYVFGAPGTTFTLVEYPLDG